MARTWLSVTVELLGGRGEQLWPWPGRVFALGPSHTFEDWQDMAAFAERQPGDRQRDVMRQAIAGRGAFRRFRDLVHDAGLADAWYAFCTDRQLGRARAWLADQGIRVGQPPAAR